MLLLQFVLDTTNILLYYKIMGNKSFGNSYGKPYNARCQVPLDLR